MDTIALLERVGYISAGNQTKTGARRHTLVSAESTHCNMSDHMQLAVILFELTIYSEVMTAK